jgi:hypothetical protein
VSHPLLKVEGRFSARFVLESGRHFPTKGEPPRSEKSGQKLAEFLSRNGQVLLPMADLIEQSRWAIDELIRPML